MSEAVRWPAPAWSSSRLRAQRVRPLVGGYTGWVSEGYPLQRWAPAEPATASLPVGA